MTSPLIPLVTLLPSLKKRQIFRHCRQGKIPGAVKIGRQWLISKEAFDAWISTRPSKTPSVLDELRAAGYR